MHVSFISTLLFAAAALAQQNAFNIPNGGYSNIQAGQNLDLSWAPSTQGTVTLVLRSGDSQNLQEGTEIVSNAPNNGHYTWSVPPSITKGFTYTVQIISAQGDINYTPYFAIDSTNTALSATSIVATGAPTGNAALPPVPSSLAAAQSSVASAAPMSSAMAMSGSSMASMSGMSMMASATSEARSAMTSAGASASMGATSAMATASAGASSAGAAATSATGASATGGAGAIRVCGGLVAGLAGLAVVL